MRISGQDGVCQQVTADYSVSAGVRKKGPGPHHN